jgi:hypothetical protein
LAKEKELERHLARVRADAERDKETAKAIENAGKEHRREMDRISREAKDAFGPLRK